MPLLSPRRLTAIAATSAIVIATVICAATPATAADVDSGPARTISGADTGLAGITGLAVGSDGTIYVSQYFSINFKPYQSDILVFAPHVDGDAAPEHVISGNDTLLDDANGLYLDSTGDLWVTNKDNIVEEFPPGADGDVKPLLKISGKHTGLSDPKGIAIDTHGSIYVANDVLQDVVVFPPGATGDAHPVNTFSVVDNGVLGDAFPYGLALESDGSIVVSDASDNAIETFASNATGSAAVPIRIISGDKTQLDSNNFLALDHEGNIFVPNDVSSSVVEFGEYDNGNIPPITRLYGGDTQLTGPFPIAIDNNENLYLGNKNNNTITVYDRLLGVTSVTPSTGSVSGGEHVTIHGYGFEPGATATFGGIAATDVVVTSSTTMTAVVPAHAAGKVNVSVTEDGTTATATDAFTYVATLAFTGTDPTPGFTTAATLLLVGGILLLARRRLKISAPTR